MAGQKGRGISWKLWGLEDIDLDIDFIITDELGGSQFRKPCEIAFRIMMTRWKLNASEIVYVEDNPAKDFQAPQQLGMKSIWFKNEDGLYGSSSGNLCIKSITDLRGRI